MTRICQASLYTGKSSQAISVSVKWIGNEVTLIHQDKNILTFSLLDIESLDRQVTDYKLTLKTTDPLKDSEMLLFSDAEFYVDLKKVWLQRRSLFKQFTQWFTDLSFSKKIVTSFAFTSLGLLGLYQIIIHIYLFLPPQYDQYIGNKGAAQILQFFEPCENDTILQFVDKMSTALTSPKDEFKLDIVVVNHPLVNAFALPGGKILLFKGLLEKAESPDEVLGVLAHEIEHIANRHGVQQLFKSMGVAFMFSLTIGSVVEGIEILETGEFMNELLSTLLFLKYARNFETEADQMAIKRLHQNHFSVDGMASFFKKMEKDTPIDSTQSTDSLLVQKHSPVEKKVSNWFSTHPTHHQRITWFEKAKKAENFAPNPLFENERRNWEQIKNSCPELKKKKNWKDFLRDYF